MVLDLHALEKFVRRLLGRNDIEDALKRLDTLTMEEARMAITETLNVTHSVDDKVAVLIEGGRYTLFLVVHAFLNVDMTRCERSKRRREAFVIWSRCHSLLKLIHPHREPITRETAKLALSPGLLGESYYCTQGSPQGNSILVFPRRYI